MGTLVPSNYELQIQNWSFFCFKQKLKIKQMSGKKKFRIFYLEF